MLRVGTTCAPCSSRHAAMQLLALADPLGAALVLSGPDALGDELQRAAAWLERAARCPEDIPVGALIDVLGVQAVLESAGMLGLPCLRVGDALDRLAHAPRDAQGFELRIALLALTADRPTLAWRMVGEQLDGPLGPGPLGVVRFLTLVALDRGASPAFADLRPMWRSFLRIFPRTLGGMLGWADLLAVAYVVHVVHGTLTPAELPRRIVEDARRLERACAPAA